MRNKTQAKFYTKVGHVKGKFHFSIFGIHRSKHECSEIIQEHKKKYNYQRGERKSVFNGRQKGKRHEKISR